MPAKKAKTKAKIGSKVKTKAKAKIKAKAKSKPETRPKAKTKAKAGPKAKSAAKKKSKTKAKAKVKTTTKKSTKAKAKTKAGTRAKVKVKAKPKVKAVKKAVPEPPAAPRLKGKKLTGKELKVARERILAERKRIIMELGRIEETISDATKEKEGSNQSYSNHLADIGTDYMEQEKNFYYASQEGHYLKALDEALERVERGIYGICEMCTLRIGSQRLEAVPSARQCIKCKSESEKGNRGR